MSRPEYTAPPEIFYNAEEARKYTSNTRMIQIQRELTERCLELLALPEDTPGFLLDIGCGSGLSGETISDHGHHWVGFDISGDMLEVAAERECGGDLIHQDMGQGVPFQPGSFDGVISVSALQWLCNQDKSSHNPIKRLKHFFTTLYGAMAHGARAVFQFYPDSPEQQMQLVTQQAMKCGFTGGIVIDYPNSTRAKKIFLCLFAGVVGSVPAGKSDMMRDTASQSTVAYTRADRRRQARRKKRAGVKSREWMMKKKESRRKKYGENSVKRDSKFSGRKRPTRF
ncbi:methyltransferase WBSCR22 [Salpingoeca rosetta]|uniref:Methyltransferase WBSCR22 n=1 Tax=Salpingoeca rosetta (strain ATCC 50818 / BSB-021) TaxID=946362 RepID=F2U6D4_SALR5|nr:methyltransferase WBSCR22 [Salpingoeca rosetta]EGD83075.1 methyltransferase WBSCR22 [Salpingoeca rosetta]|eukprot:XP_004995439.1 methyltransferase WBSCR22 [Salpingoeca rosetta]